jgi:hypothetical protein
MPQSEKSPSLVGLFCQIALELIRARALSNASPMLDVSEEVP